MSESMHLHMERLERLRPTRDCRLHSMEMYVFAKPQTFNPALEAELRDLKPLSKP